MKAYPTIYQGCRFRSRLEAKWAAFFDAVGWPWEYEPLDFDGYIPDFLLKIAVPTLVEVKPACGWEELRRWEHDPKIQGAIEWGEEFLIVGVGLMPDEAGCFREGLGWLKQADAYFEEANLIRCLNCKQIGFYHTQCTYFCRVCGYGGDRGRMRDGVVVNGFKGGGDGHLGCTNGRGQQLWRKACNAVQWNPPVVADHGD